MTDKYHIVLEETRQVIDNLFHEVEVDESFTEYMDGLRASTTGCLMKLYPLCQGKADRLEMWKNMRSIYDHFVEKADLAWYTYITNRDSKLAFKSRVCFDGHEIKTFFLLPKDNSEYTDKLNLAAKYSVFLRGYIKDFQRMKRAKLKGETAPHKVILLLAIIDLIEYKGGKLISTERLYECIPFGCGLDEYFMEEWIKHVHTDTFKPSLENPIIHMSSEPFYSLKLKDGAEATNTHSLSAIRKSYLGIVLEKNLITLMLDTVARDRLRTSLIEMVN